MRRCEILRCGAVDTGVVPLETCDVVAAPGCPCAVEDVDTC